MELLSHSLCLSGLSDQISHIMVGFYLNHDMTHHSRRCWLLSTILITPNSSSSSSSSILFLFYTVCWTKSSFLSSPNVSFSLPYQLFHLFLMSSSIRLNHLFLGHPTHIFPLNFKSNALLCILVLPILSMWLNHCNNVSSGALWTNSALEPHF